MILAYEFEYVSKNLVLESFLRVISEEFGAKYKICKEKNITILYIDEEEERQHEFADFLSSSLPVSVFLKSSNAKVTDSIKGKELDFSDTAISLPFTRRAIELAKDENSFFYRSPFVPNEVGFSKIFQRISLSLENANGLMVVNNSEGYNDIYKSIANSIKNGEKVKIKTPNGNFVFFRVKKGAFKDIESFEIIPTDLSLVQKMVNLRENEIQALAFLEKPLIRAKVNMVFETFDILPSSRVKISMPKTPMLQFICEELYKNGVEFIAKSSDDVEYSHFLSCDIDIPKIASMEVSILENGEIFILNADGFSTQESKKGLENLKVPSIRQFVSILKERELFNDKASCFYFSKKYDDAIMYHDEEKYSVLSLVEFPTFSTVRELFNHIKKEDESGEKLIENYKKTYPQLYKSIQRVKIPKKLSNNLFNTLRFVSIIVGFSDDFKKAADTLIEKAEDFGGQKGVRIDFRLKDEKKINSKFNPYRLLRSAMSFKLAGADDMTMSFGILESFSYFISDIADSHKETLGSNKITLGGSLFGYPLIAELVAKNLLPNHKIYFNQELPIDNL
ncbi:MAG: hypothetical protein QM482_07095 [Sulfurospirillum sp.]